MCDYFLGKSNLVFSGFITRILLQLVGASLCNLIWMSSDSLIEQVQTSQCAYRNLMIYGNYSVT